MEITSVQVFLVPENGKMKAFARVCLDDELMLTSMRVYQGTHGLFVSYPNDTNYKGEDYKQLFYPISKAFRDKVEEAVLKAYEEELAEMED